jgi:hypothetical protein
MGQMLARADFAFDTSAVASLARYREFEVELKTTDGGVRAQKCLLWQWRDGLLVQGALPFVPWDGGQMDLELQEKVQDAGGFFAKQMFYNNAKMQCWEASPPTRCEEWRLCVVADNGLEMGLGGAPLVAQSSGGCAGDGGKSIKAEWHRLSTLRPWGMSDDKAEVWRAEVIKELDGLTAKQQVRLGKPPMFPEAGSWPPSAVEWLKHPPSTEA